MLTMFFKLIKNELKANIHTIGFIYVAAAIAVAFMAFAYVFKINWISATATILLAIAGGAAILVTFIMVIVNFQKTLFSNQGYLSFTLPVTSGQLLVAKAITSFFWMLLSYLVAIAIFFGIYLYATAMVGDDVKAAINLLKAFTDAFPSKETIRNVLILGVIFIFIKIAFVISQLFFAITLSNTRIMQKFGGFAIIVAFFVVFIGTTVISTWLTNTVPLSIVITPTDIYYSTTVSMTAQGHLAFGLTGVIFDVVFGALLFYLTTHLMEYKVNLK